MRSRSRHPRPPITRISSAGCRASTWWKHPRVISGSAPVARLEWRSIASSCLSTAARPISISTASSCGMHCGTRQPKVNARFDGGSETTPLWSFKAGYGGTSGIFHSRLGPFAVKSGTYTSFAGVDVNTNAFEAKAYWNRLHGDTSNLINGLNFIFDTNTYATEMTGRRAFASRVATVFGVSLRESRFDLSIAPHARKREE